jgi:hypothetical protein
MAEEFTNRTELKSGCEVWAAFKAQDINGYDIVRIEFIDGSALEIRADGLCSSLVVTES